MSPTQKHKRATSKSKLKQPEFIWPMNALLTESVPARGNWLYEIKWDGYRAVAVKTGRQTQLYSRRYRLVTEDFPEIARAISRIPDERFTLDGEIVALNEDGRASFQLLQNFRQHSAADQRNVIYYYAFDLLNSQGRDLTNLPLTARKELLERLLRGVPDPIRFSASLPGDPHQLLEHARHQGLEGLIAKRADSVYEPGRRTGAWIKLKITLEQEFVIGGYTAPQGSRPHFGAVLVGHYEGDKLIFVSRVGTGFNTKTLGELHQMFQRLRTDRPPFSNVPSRRAGRFGGGLTAAEMRRCTWLQPKLVAQVRFTEWTDEGGIRHPVFLGLRDDKPPRDVVRERPVPSPAHA